MAASFDYEKKVWGSIGADLSIFNSYYLALKYCLKSLAGVKGKVLDIGCGAGAFTAGLKKYRSDLELIGLDWSQKAVGKAKLEHKNIKFIKASAVKTPFGNTSFNAIISHHLLEHLTSPKLAVKEAYRLLKPKGVFYSAVPLEGSQFCLIKWLRLIPGFSKVRKKYLDHQQAFSIKGYLNLLLSLGFSIEKIYFGGFFVYQFIEAIYYPLLSKLKKKPEYLAETAIQKSESWFFRQLFYRGKSLINLISNLESLLLVKLPGFVIYVKAVKNDKD